MNNFLTPLYELFTIINETIYSLGQTAGFITGLILVLSGILLAYWGFKLKKITLFIIGSILGICLGIFINSLFEITSLEVKIIILIISTISCAFATFALYFIAIFIIGIFIGGGLGFIIGILFELNLIYTIFICIILAVIGGFLSLKLNKIMFIILTAYYGYLLFRVGLFAVNIIGVNKIIEEILALILLTTGLIYQFIDNTNNPAEENSE